MIRILFPVLLIFISNICFAQQPPSMSDPITGVSIIFDETGTNWDKIMSVGESELLFGDTKDVRTATKKATMRAKANIAKFLNERLTTSEVLEEMTKTLTEQSSDGSAKASRKSVETMIEKIENQSEAILKGVIVLEQDINKPQKQVYVTVGMSRKTMQAADGLRNTIQKDLDTGSQNLGNQDDSEDSSNDERIIKRSRNYDNF